MNATDSFSGSNDSCAVTTKPPPSTMSYCVKLRSISPLSYFLAKNATYKTYLIKVAALAGAKAGSSFGSSWAMKSGARAGAKAGAMAGMAAGASAGATAGVTAAIKAVTKTLQEGLNELHGDDLHKYKINVVNGTVVSVTGPGIGGAAGTAGAGAAAGALSLIHI